MRSPALVHLGFVDAAVAIDKCLADVSLVSAEDRPVVMIERHDVAGEILAVTGGNPLA